MTSKPYGETDEVTFLLCRLLVVWLGFYFSKKPTTSSQAGNRPGKQNYKPKHWKFWQYFWQLQKYKRAELTLVILKIKTIYSIYCVLWQG